MEEQYGTSVSKPFHEVLIIQLYTLCIRRNMKTKYSQSKDVLLSTRLTPRIKELVKISAASEGLYPSEWMLMLIVKELNHKDLLTHKITGMRDFGKLEGR